MAKVGILEADPSSLTLWGSLNAGLRLDGGVKGEFFGDSSSVNTFMSAWVQISIVVMPVI